MFCHRFVKTVFSQKLPTLYGHVKTGLKQMQVFFTSQYLQRNICCGNANIQDV